MSESNTHTRLAGLTLREWTKKAIVFLLAALVMGWFYGWASPRAYPKDSKVGFDYGLLHGALMPMALPSLAMGQDVDIFAANNSGRWYKLGYIIGINVCGLIFFGSALWQPKRNEIKAASGSSHIQPSTPNSL